MKRLEKGSYSRVATDYARNIVVGKIEACWQIKAACQRHLNDFSRRDLEYRPDLADHACQFVENLPHVIGPLAGQPIKLEPFQLFLICNLFGWTDRKTGLRRYREGFVLLPRGNAKSTIAAGIGIYMSFCQGQGGAEGLSGATSMAQAEAVFTPAKRMVEMTPALQDALGIEVAARSIYQVASGSSFRPVIAKTKDGGLPWIAIADELHQALDSTQLDAFRTGMGKRRGADPLLLIISTAGTNTAGVCRQEQLYFEAVLAGTIKDDSKFALIYTIDPADDWKDFSVWRKANPNYGVSVDEKHLRNEYEKALQSPSAQTTALTKYLNVWCNTATGWINQRDWSACADAGLMEDGEPVVPKNSRCFLGVDLSTKTDLTAVVMLALAPDGRRYIYPFLFLPTGALERSKNAKAYAEWIAAGYITQTEGEASDHAKVEDKIRELCAQFSIEEVAFDTWQGATISQSLVEDGIAVAEVGQKATVMHPIMVDFEADLLNRRLVHTDNPVLNWMAQNISITMRGPFMSPGKPTGQDHLKIDGIIAGLMAYALSQGQSPAPSVDMLMFV